MVEWFVGNVPNPGVFEFNLRQHSRNQNQPQRAQSNFFADYANHRRKLFNI
ncbi:hypothetical protein [Caldithrix abyssi]|uniref:Uncharacterized protein n=1 Tax=Caldithrix abyssi DSM 13497 TaxID=880073 RepID=A0A1J1C652_CALAY|nr:hypothetical protein [Caldithrix abyssi]APF17876.1 hypothetical protein Cabys_1127 [Caldithrix abyssi DSM 13497]